MLHEKDYIAKITKAREDEDSMAFQRECHGDSTNLHRFVSTEAFLEEREIRENFFVQCSGFIFMAAR